MESPLLDSGLAGSAKDEGSLVALLQVFISSLGLFHGVQGSNIQMCPVLGLAGGIGVRKASVQSVKTESLDLEVSKTRPVWDLVLDWVERSL